jgi:hypothetical protein
VSFFDSDSDADSDSDTDTDSDSDTDTDSDSDSDDSDSADADSDADSDSDSSDGLVHLVHFSFLNTNTYTIPLQILHGGVVVVAVLAATVSLFAATWRATLTLRREDALPAKTNVVVVEVIFVGSCIDGVYGCTTTSDDVIF